MLLLLVCVACSLLKCGGGGSETVQQKETLYLLSLLPYFNAEPTLNPSWSDGDNILPALELAHDQINAHTDILKNYKLELIQAESGCQLVSTTMVSFVEETYHSRGQRRIAGILGPGCSSSTIALGPLTNRSDITIVMLHGSGSPNLANRKKYPYHLGTLGSSENFASAMLYLLQKWKRVAILYDNSRMFYSHTNIKLIEKLNNTSTEVEYLSTVSFHFLPLNVIKEQLIRIVFVLCPPELTRRLICLSWHRNMTYNNYQWVYTAHTEKDLVKPVKFRYENKNISCSEAQMSQALNNQILLVYSLETSHKGILDPLNITNEDFHTMYMEYRKEYNARGDVRGKNSTYSYWTSYIYDSVWAWALVLDNLTKTDPEMFVVNGSKLYGDVMRSNLIMEQFYNTRFEGVSGPISYDRSTGFTPRSVNLMQIASEGEVWKKGKLIVQILSDEERYVYSDPIQILDSFPKEYLRENKHLARFFMSVAILLFLMTVALHVMTILNHEQPAIKATTPKLLHMSYMGAYIMLLGLFLYSIYPAVPLDQELKGVFCQVFWSWTVSIGFTLSLGPVAMRTWRLYRIFIHYLNPGPFISNPILITVVVIMLIVDVLLAVTWTALDRVETEKLVQEVFQSDFKIVQERAFCSSKWYHWWILLLIVNKLLLLAFVTTLAFLTRNIKNLSFATNSLRVLVYMTAAICVLGFTLSIFLSFPVLNPNYNFTALSITVIALISVVLVCVFMPPLLPTFRAYYSRTQIVNTWTTKHPKSTFSQ